MPAGARTVNPDDLNKVLGAIPYGLYVVGSTEAETVGTIVANWVTQVSFSPAMIGIAIETDSRMKILIERSGVFCLNLLRAGDTGLAKAFLKAAESSGDSVNGREFTRTKRGTPFLRDALGSIECEVTSALPSGDHTLFLGKIVGAAWNGGGDALTLRETGWKYRG